MRTVGHRPAGAGLWRTLANMAPKRAAQGASSKAAKKPRAASKAPTAPAGLGTTGAGGAPDIEDLQARSFSQEEVAQARAGLLAWYDANHRILPWRRNPHSQLPREAVEAARKEGREGAPLDLPTNQFIYWVWVCEVMSQQTQVSRAAEYFQRWTAKWPTVGDLAGASQEDVNDMWAGLGYYRRARYLLEGAQYVVGQLGGTFPTTAKELLKIPGVGAYTSAAIASIACGQRVAVVDGNVIRVLARLRRISGDPRSAATTKLFAELADALVDPDRPGDFNQAMMELGATVCVPNAQPCCGDCPVSGLCQAYAAEQAYVAAGGGLLKSGAPRVTDYPTKVEKAEKREETVAVAVVQLAPPGGGGNSSSSSSSAPADLKASQFLLVQRPKDGLLAGLWEFPLVSVPATAKKAQLQSAMDAYLSPLLGLDPGAALQAGATPRGEAAGGAGGVTVAERAALGELVHTFSHIRMTLKAERIVLRGHVEDLPAVASASSNSNSRGSSSEEGGLQWLSYADLQAKGLSSSVRKVLGLLQKAAERDKAGLGRFLARPGAARKAGQQAQQQVEQEAG